MWGQWHRYGDVVLGHCIQVTWIQALWYCNRSDDWDGHSMASGVVYTIWILD
jgi:hypothetical protein